MIPASESRKPTTLSPKIEAHVVEDKEEKTNTVIEEVARGGSEPEHPSSIRTKDSKAKCPFQPVIPAHLNPRLGHALPSEIINVPI